MQTIKLRTFSYTHLESQLDVTGIPLNRNLFGINNRIYANMFSVGMDKEDIKKYSKHFSKEELEYPLLNRLYEVHISCRTHDDEYETIKEIDFGALFEFVEKDYEKYESIYARFNDSGNASEKELGVLHLPLNCNVLRQGCNYAYQEIERIKTENFLMKLNPGPLKNFLNIF